MNRIENKFIEIHFNLDIEDEWPPVGQEGLVFIKKGDLYVLYKPPLFVKNLSIGDLLEIDIGEFNFAENYQVIEKSGNSTVWLARIADCNSLKDIFDDLKQLHCHVVELPQLGCYSIAVPFNTKISDIDKCLSQLNPNQIAIAYPSFRHNEE